MMRSTIIFHTKNMSNKTVELACRTQNHAMAGIGVCLDCGEVVSINPSGANIMTEQDQQKHEGHKLFIRHGVNFFTIVEVVSNKK